MQTEPSYITWYNAHAIGLAKMSPELAEIAEGVYFMTPEARREFARVADELCRDVAPGWGSTLVRWVESTP
jgi:hypothetical protein